MGLINSIGAFFRKVTGGWEFGTQISKLLFTKNVEIVGTDDMLYEYQFQEKSGTIAHLDDISNDVTYAELHTLIDSSQLIAGAFYRVTDFSTIHRILNTADINFGPIEPMVTFATASDQVSSFARSITYPQDIIEINWNSRLAEDGITPRAGTIVYREDTLRRIRVQGFDFRNTRWRRWKILSKQYEVPVATGPDSFTITLTFSANLTSTYLDRYREWSVKFPVDAVHDAGPINITVTKGAFTFTRPLLQSNNSTTWTPNQLANLTGPLVYCPVRDVFLLMNIGQTGEQLVGFYLARLGGEVLTVGNNVRFDVDPNDFMDYTTFDDTRTILDVNMWGRCDNNVFFGNVNMLTIETYGLNNTFRGNVNYSSLKIWSYNNIFNSTWDWSTPEMELQNNLVLMNMAYLDVGAWTYNNTFVCTGNYSFESEHSFAACTLIIYMSFFECHYGGIGNGIFLSGGISSGFRILRPINFSLIGYFNGSGVVIDRILANTSIYEKPLAQLSLSSVNINLLPAPQGPVSPLGIDSEGNVVDIPDTYPQTVATVGIINDLELANEGVKLLILTLADELTGVVPVTTTLGRELKIEGRTAGGVIIRHESVSSIAANRFSLPGAVDLTIAQNEVHTFIYTDGRWRRVDFETINSTTNLSVNTLTLNRQIIIGNVTTLSHDIISFPQARFTITGVGSCNLTLTPNPLTIIGGFRTVRLLFRDCTREIILINSSIVWKTGTQPTIGDTVPTAIIEFLINEGIMYETNYIA